MSQCDDLRSLFEKNNGELTLGQILNTTLAAEYRARMTDLRKRGYFITCERGARPSENRYRLIPPVGNQMRLAV